MLTLPFAALLASFLDTVFSAAVAAAMVSFIIYWLDWANDADRQWKQNLVWLRRGVYVAINWLILMIILTQFATVEQLMKLG
jgi:hypothetical protein